MYLRQFFYRFPIEDIKKGKVHRFDSKGESTSDFAEKFFEIGQPFDKDFQRVVLE